MAALTWLITGASSGLGHALAEHVLEQGQQAVMGARTLEPMMGLAASHPESALAAKLDVTDPEDRANFVKVAQDRFGAIDVLVNNAGIDYLGAIEEQDERDYRAQFEVNFFAPVALLRLVLPGMRSHGRGIIVNVSSMDGIASLPGNAFYASSKFALEGLTEALWQEIEPFGLRALLVEPGSFRTGIEKRTHWSGTPIDAYASTPVGDFRAAMQTLIPEMFPGDPARAAKVIYEMVSSGRMRHWVILGSDAHRRIGVKLDLQRQEYDAGKEIAFGTDFPGATTPAVL